MVEKIPKTLDKMWNLEYNEDNKRMHLPTDLCARKFFCADGEIFDANDEGAIGECAGRNVRIHSVGK